jgi:hypothetical protein
MRSAKLVALVLAASVMGACGAPPDEDGLNEELEGEQGSSVQKIKASASTTQNTKVTEWRVARKGGPNFTVNGVDSKGKTLFKADFSSLPSKGGVLIKVADTKNKGEFRLTSDGRRARHLTSAHQQFFQGITTDFQNAPHGCIASFLGLGVACTAAAVEIGANPLVDAACVVAYIAYVEDCGAS